MSSHDEKTPPRSLKVRIIRPYFDNVVVHEPGAEITLADAQAFSITGMEWVEEPAPEPVAPPIETPKPEPPEPEAAPRIMTPRIETPLIDSGVTAAALRKREYRKRKREREQAKAARKKRGAPAVVMAPPAAEAATPAALPVAGDATPPSSILLTPFAAYDAALPPQAGAEKSHMRLPCPLTGEEGDSMSSEKTLALPSKPTPASGNESAAAAPTPPGAGGEGSAPPDTSAPPSVT